MENELYIECLRQMLFRALKTLAGNSKCDDLKADMSQKWFSGFNTRAKRLLPDGKIVDGAPWAVDLQLRDDIVSEVVDGLKTRPRKGFDIACSRYAITLKEWDMALAITGLYSRLHKAPEKYDLAELAATVNVLCGLDDPERIEKPFGEEDYNMCEI